MREVWQSYTDKPEVRQQQTESQVYHMKIVKQAGNIYLLILIWVCFTVGVVSIISKAIPLPVILIIGMAFLLCLFLLFARQSGSPITVEMDSDKLVIRDTKTRTISFNNITSYSIDNERMVRLRIWVQGQSKMVFTANSTFSDVEPLKKFIFDFEDSVKTAMVNDELKVERKPSFFEGPYGLPVMIGLSVFWLIAVIFSLIKNVPLNAGIIASGISIPILWNRYYIAKKNAAAKTSK